jgi:tetratricopeptide (TPR) repeat protein/transglutaminase-like putative cysteine protease
MVLRRSLVLLAPTFLFLYASAGAQTPGPDPERKAWEAMLRADFHGAAAIYLDLLEAGRDGPMADYHLLRALENAGRAGRRGTDLSKKALALADASGNAVARAQATWIRSAGALRAGKIAEAEKHAAGLGFVRDWAVIGPFDNAGEAGFKEVYGPEKDLAARTGFMDFDRVHPGKQGKNRWRIPGVRHPLFAVDFSNLFRLSEQVCGYACTHVRTAEPVDTAFRLGTDGAVKLWVNGRLVHAGDTYRRAVPDQDVVPVRLAAGWNEVLVKACVKKGPWTLWLRITAPDGGPQAGLDVSPDPREADADVVRTTPAETDPAAAFDGAAGHLAALCKEGNPAPLTRARLAFLLLVRRSLDENDRRVREQLKEAVKADPRSAFLRLMLSSEEIDRNRALEQAREARRLAPGAALPAYAVSRFYGAPRPIQWLSGFYWFDGDDSAVTQEEYSRIREVEMPGKERALLEEALKAAPEFVEAHKALACHYFRRAGGDPRRPGALSPGKPFALEAKRILAKVVGLAGEDVRVSKMLDAFEVGGPEAVLARSRRNLARDFTDAASRAALAGTLLSLGRVEECVGVLGDRLRINPSDLKALREMASAYRTADRFEKAAACLEMALAVGPENVDVLRELGDLQLIRGKTEAGLALFRRALEIRPQMADLSKRVRALAPKAKAEFYAAFRRDLKAIARAARKDEPEDKVPAVVYFKNDVIRILPNGTAKHFHQRVVKVLTEKGVNQYRSVSAWPGRYDYYTRTRGEVKEAKVYRADGSVTEGAYREGSTYARFDDLKEGDVLVFEVKAEEVGEPRYKGYFGLMLLLQDGTDPVRESRVTFLYPKEKPLYFHAVGAPAKPGETTHGDLFARSWALENIPEVKEEFNMPGLFELCPYVHASTFRSWEEVSTWYSNLVKDQFESSAEIRKTVAEITKGLSSPEEKVDAVFRFMVSDIRYESLDLADHAYRPFKSRQTFDRKYGDCKDTAALFRTMLKEAGIEAYMVLIRAGLAEKIDLVLPSMKIFNHAIAFVPGVGPKGKGLLMDGTARYCGSRELPDMDQGAVAFIVGVDGKGRALYTPYDEPAANLHRSAYTVDLAADGSATLKLNALVRGQQAYGFRSEYQEGTKRREEMERQLNRAFKAATVQTIRFSDLADYNKPVGYEVAFKVPALGRTQDREMALRPALEMSNLCENFAPTDERYHDLVLGYPRRVERTVDIVLPEGWTVKRAPKSVKSEGPLGFFEMVLRADNRKVQVQIVLELRAPRVKKADYAAFRRFCEEVDRAEEEELVLVKE